MTYTIIFKRTFSVIISIVMLTTLFYIPSLKTTAAVSALWPVPSNFKTITTHFDSRRNTVNPENTNYHNAMDIAATSGTDIYAVYDGTVEFSGWKDSYGNFVVLYHPALGVYTFYAHASSLVAKKGASVKQGDIIAKVGSTGNSSGPHLHFGICSKVESGWPRRTYYDPETYFTYSNSPVPPATSNMTISGQTIPSGVLKKGSFFGIYGNITSNLPISLVWGGVYKSDWTVTSQYAEASPNTTSYSLYPYFDNKIVFNGLDEGAYHYLIKAKDTSGKEYPLISSDFTIGNSSPSSSMSISGQTIPSGTLQQGKFFAIKGIISSNLNITKVWGGVYNRDGYATSQYTEATLNSTKYDLSTYFDSKIVFNNLPVGYYTYKIQAKDSSGKEYTLIDSDFQIGNPKTLEFKSSTTSVSLNGAKDEKKQVTFSYANYDDPVTISFENGNNRVTNLEWGDWSDKSIPLTIEGYTNGTETFTVKLKNTNNENILASINITVTVYGIETKLNASTKSVSIDMDKGEKKGVTFSFENVPALTQEVNIRVHGEHKATTLEWSEWENHTATLYITGYRTGKEDITVELFDLETKEVLAEQIITVTVTGTPEITASSNSVTLDYNSKTSKDVKISFNNFPYNCSIYCLHGDNVITSTKWNGWDNETNTITISPTSPGNEILTIQLLSPSGDVIISTKISVNVIAKFKVNLNANGGKIDISSKEVVFGEKYENLATPVRDGYIFDGWYTEITNGNLVTNNSTVNIKSDETLFAHWTKIPDPLSVTETNVALNTGDRYSIVANQDNLVYKSNNISVATVSDDGVVLALNQGNAIISVINSSYEVVQINVTVTNSVDGDCNSDGVFNEDDVILLQQWLLSASDVKLMNWKAADLYADDKLDVFDLCLMKRLLFKSNK